MKIRRIKNFSKSQELLKEVLNIIPLGSQTRTKSYLSFPREKSPHFAYKAKGGYLWDIDGNKYLDFINALTAVNLGYQDPDVDRAVKEQMKKGVIFSLPHEIESILALKIQGMFDSAEMVRFAKNGCDVTTAAVRLARAYTNREHIAVCGYHGWHDWYVANIPSMNLGVPECVKELTHFFDYNNFDSVESIFRLHPGKIAAVIMEPMNIEYPQNNFLHKVKDLANQSGSLFILDEVVTGLRFSEGGAQKVFDIMPDLTCLGKSIANGYPLSALIGKKAIMSMLDEVYFTSTYAGDCLAISAAISTLDKIKTHNVINENIEKGTKLLTEGNRLIEKKGLQNVLKISGHPNWSFILFNDIKDMSSYELKMYYIQEVIKRGVLCFGEHSISYAHSNQDIEYLLSVYDIVFNNIKKLVG
jgi:glutamate-1-semialdehyde 2,1-aminomutase